jgi:predicted dehydrogenase
MKPIGIAIVGCGNISDIYLTNFSQSQYVKVLACADLDVARAKATAEKHNVGYGATLEQVLQDDDVKIIVNLTTPNAHAFVAMAALNAGKHVYNEKPLALSLTDAKAMLDLARAKNLRVGCAPDTFMGGGLQTCRQLIDAGAIGIPVAATAFMMCPGHESWHPNPNFYYQPGAGPLFDMGPYYLTALISILGSVKNVMGQARISFPQRTITSQPNNGQIITVATPTHISALLEFENGTQASLITSFDVQATNLPSLEIYGSTGSLSLPDPNTFGGPVRLFSGTWQDIPIVHHHTENSRGIGVIDIANAITNNTNHRSNGELAYHVLEVMHAILESATQKTQIIINSTSAKPEAIPVKLRLL